MNLFKKYFALVLVFLVAVITFANFTNKALASSECIVDPQGSWTTTYEQQCGGGNTLCSQYDEDQPCHYGAQTVYMCDTSGGPQNEIGVISSIGCVWTGGQGSPLPGPPVLPTLTVTASPSQIYSQGTSTINWASTNTTSCNTYGHGSGTSGSFVTAPLTTTTTYPIVCSTPNNAIIDNVSNTTGGKIITGTQTVSASSYLPGATITLSGFLQASGTPGGSELVELTAEINGTVKTLISETTLNFTNSPYQSVSGSNTFTAPNTPGNYVAKFKRWVFDAWYTKDIAYVVSATSGLSTSASATVQVLPTVINIGANPSILPVPDHQSDSTISWQAEFATWCDLTANKTGVIFHPPATTPAGPSNVTNIISDTIFTIVCGRDIQTEPGSCYGNYPSTLNICTGVIAGSVCNGSYGGIPDGTPCGPFGGGQNCVSDDDPSCHQGCSKAIQNTTTSCVGLEQSECGSHPGCGWIPETTIPGVNATASTTVTVSNTPLVDYMWFENNTRAITIGYDTSTRLKWETTGLNNNDHVCDIRKSNGELLNGISGAPLSNLEVNSPLGVSIEKQRKNDNFKIECHERTAATPGSYPVITDPAGKSYLSITGGQFPDLTIEGLVNPSTVYRSSSQAQEFTATVKNVGNKESGGVGANEGFYGIFQYTTVNPNAGGNMSFIQKGSNFIKSLFGKEVNAADEGYFKSDLVSHIGAGGIAIMRAYKTFPSAGLYYFRACADKSTPTDSGTVNESDEGNNCGPWSTVAVVAPGDSPDLTINTPVTPNTAIKGTPVNMSSTVKNIGAIATGGAGTKFWNFYQITQTDPNASGSGSSSTALNTKNNFFKSLFYTKANAAATGGGGGGTSTTTNLPPREMNALAAGASDTTIGTYAFTNVGLYYVRACADKSAPTNTGKVTESNEFNNCGPWTTITVALAGTHPDLTVFTTTPTSASSSGNTTLTAQVKNIGQKATGATGSTFLNFFQVSTINPNALNFGSGGAGSAMLEKNNSFGSLFYKKANAAQVLGVTNLTATSKEMNELLVILA